MSKKLRKRDLCPICNEPLEWNETLVCDNVCRLKYHTGACQAKVDPLRMDYSVSQRGRTRYKGEILSLLGVT